MNVVEANGLGKRFGRAWALRECTLEIPAGRVAALVGPNGAGKTTLLNLAVGLTRPTAGDVTVLGATGRARGPRLTGSRSSLRTRRCTRRCRSRTCST